MTVEPLAFYVSAVIIGYALGRIDAVVRMLKGPVSTSFVSEVVRDQKVNRSKIQIDEAKYVTDVSTSGLEAPGNTALGEVSASTDDISSAAAKLSQLKKRKG